MIPVMLLFVGTGALFIALALPMVRRRVKPNRFYGLRVRATFADEQVWYDANAASGRDLIRVGVSQILFAIALGVVPGISGSSFALANAAFVLVSTLFAALVGWRRAERLLAQRGRPRRGA